jgi:uncharacterized protein YggU (UPF0235/DUF167 family)
LNVPRSSVTIASGLSSRNKVIRVAGVTGDLVRNRLHLPMAGKGARATWKSQEPT